MGGGSGSCWVTGVARRVRPRRDAAARAGTPAAGTGRGDLGSSQAVSRRIRKGGVSAQVLRARSPGHDGAHGSAQTPAPVPALRGVGAVLPAAAPSGGGGAYGLTVGAPAGGGG